MRRCLFCGVNGDGDVFGAGRLLYSGDNEWVHVNCALWSAEVYEDEEGRLKHVYDAVKRGNKIVRKQLSQLLLLSHMILHVLENKIIIL